MSHVLAEHAAPLARNPVASMHQRTRRLVIAATVSLAAVATWACWPLSQHKPLELIRLEPAALPADKHSQRDISDTSFDVGAFDAPLWTVAQPPTPPPPPPPPPPFTLQLLGIDAVLQGDAASYRAVFFDPSSDTLRTVRVGDDSGTSGGNRVVKHIDARSVTVGFHRAEGATPPPDQRLSLDDPAPAGAGASNPGRAPR
jgi:hypothetical protein